MDILKLNECGCQEALIGNLLSFRVPDPMQPIADMLASFSWEEAQRIAERLKNKPGGHNKFLQQIDTWWLIRASRKWWTQFDTYRHAIQSVDESVVLSESTMHTILKRPLCQEDFDHPIWPTYLTHLNDLIAEKRFEEVTDGLPQSFLQTRSVKLNYEVLRNILNQRSHHKLREWSTFCRTVREQVDHPELLPES